MNELNIFYKENKKAIEYALYQIRTKGYSTKNISKKNGSSRELNIPNNYVKSVQRNFNVLLQKLYIAPSPVHGFIKNKSGIIKNIITNANQHIKKNILINLDIEDFFGSINFGRVRGIFLAKPFEANEKIATKLAQLVIYENKLPQGAPTSPIIANIISLQLDHQLIQIAKKYKMVYTRYADDLTFSSYSKKIDQNIVLNEIEKVLNDNGFKLNQQKTRTQYLFQKQLVTGIKVNQKINLNREYIRQIRSILFSWYTKGIEEATLIHFHQYNKQRSKYANETKMESFKKIVLGKIIFLGQVLGKENPNYIKFKHIYHLLNCDFNLEKYPTLETYDLKTLSINQTIKIFTQIYDTILIFTEGTTDVIYIKEALKYFQLQGAFLNIKLRYCTMEGWGDIKKLHEILYKEDLKNDNDAIKIKNIIVSNMSKHLKTCFVLDADEPAILKYFNSQPVKNYFLLDESNRGYIEKMFDKSIIIDFIKQSGYVIDINRQFLSEKSKTGLKEYLDSQESNNENIHAPKNTSYIAYKNKIVEKTKLAEHIKGLKNVNYDNFKYLFYCLTNLQSS